LVPHVLGFGGCEGPSDYQRLSCLKHHIIVDMLATSLGCSPLPAPSGWQGTIRYSAPDMNTCRALFPEEGVSAYIDLRLRKFPHSPLQWLPLWVGIYLDDHNSLTLGPHVASWLFDTMVRAADHFGWILSMKKWFAEGTPSTSKILLGVQYDFVSLTKSIPEDKVLFATKQIRGILRANGLFMSDLFSCLMRLLNLSVCIPYMRLFLNEGFILLRLAKKGVGISRSGWISLSAPFSHDLRWMIKGILANPGVPISRAVAPLPSAQWHTDASGRFSGGWMWSDSSETEVLLFKAIPWSREERRWCDINVLEALGLLFAATAFGPFLRGRVVRANTDNLNVAFALEKQKSHSALASVLAKLFHVCAEFAIEIDCHWVERALNHVADDLSKDHLSSALSSLGSPKHRIPRDSRENPQRQRPCDPHGQGIRHRAGLLFHSRGSPHPYLTKGSRGRARAGGGVAWAQPLPAESPAAAAPASWRGTSLSPAPTWGLSRTRQWPLLTSRARRVANAAPCACGYTSFRTSTPPISLFS